MPRLFAFLRAINVGGHTVTMARLGELFTGFGLADVETFIASGNVVFSSRSPGGSRLEARIARGLESALGYPVATFLRTEQELARIAGSRPFDAAATPAAGTLLVGMLAATPGRAAVARVMALRTSTDDFRVQGRELYWHLATRQSDSTLSSNGFERALGAPVTFRNMNTIQRLAAKYAITPA